MPSKRSKVDCLCCSGDCRTLESCVIVCGNELKWIVEDESRPVYAVGHYIWTYYFYWATCIANCPLCGCCVLHVFCFCSFISVEGEDTSVRQKGQRGNSQYGRMLADTALMALASHARTLTNCALFLLPSARHSQVCIQGKSWLTHAWMCTHAHAHTQSQMHTHSCAPSQSYELQVFPALLAISMTLLTPPPSYPTPPPSYPTPPLPPTPSLLLPQWTK